MNLLQVAAIGTVVERIPSTVLRWLAMMIMNMVPAKPMDTEVVVKAEMVLAALAVVVQAEHASTVARRGRFI